jgi:hypothetical protein
MKTVQISMVVATTVCVALSGAVVAQERIPELQRDGAAGGKAVTLSGCVARGGSSGTYTLASNVKVEAAPTDADQPRTVALAGTDVDLAPHLGHIVSLTGSYLAATEPTAGTEKPAPAADASKPLRTFTVKSLQMVAASCSEATQ